MKKIITTSIVAIALATTMVNAKDKVIGTVGGINITEAEANKFLTAITPKGKKTILFADLSRKDKDTIVKNLAPGTLIKSKAQKEVSQDEKEQIIANYWMQKKLADFKATDSEAKKIYTKNKKSYVKNKKQLTFKEVKEFIKMQIKQKKLVDSVMKNVKVVISK
jgi:tellurite resistance protein